MFTLRNKSYESRLKTLNLTSLEERRNGGDLIKMFKIARRKDKVGWVKEPRKIISSTKGRNSRYQRELSKNLVTDIISL